MNTKLFLPRAAFALTLLLTACSGNKKDHSGHDQTTAPVSEIKAFDNVDASVKAQLNGFLTDYFALNQTLIEDNQDGAKVAAQKLSETVKQFDMSKLNDEQMSFYHAHEAKLKQGLGNMLNSSDIEETRMELSVVTESLYALVKAYHPNESELYFQFCPMAKNGEGANWISNTADIINPYMGQRMLKCGKTQEKL